ncbi:MAG: DNA internalization-related competence protein ComEC/Rec2 [Nitrospirota bacterium]
MHSFLSFLAGVILFPAFPFFPAITTLATLSILLYLSAKRKYLAVPALFLGILSSFWRTDPVVEIPWSKDPYVVKGMFSSNPVRTGSETLRQVFRVEEATNQESGYMAAWMTGKEIEIVSEEEFQPYAEYGIAIRMFKNRERRNPGEYTEAHPAAYLLGVYSQGEVKKPFLAGIEEFRHRINAYLENRFGGDEGAFLSSITTGEQASISRDLRNDFNRTGLTHILSISGSHFGLFSVFLFTLFRVLIGLLPYSVLQRLTIFLTPSQAAAALCFPFVLAYLGISGASVPAVRSCIMISFFLLGLIIGRKNSWLASLLFAAFFLVAWNHDVLFSLSFQLSFIAVLFIGFSLKTGNEDNERKKSRAFENTLRVTAAASIGTAPLVAYSFHYFSVISPATNLLVGPLIGFVIIPLAVFSAFLFPITGDFLFAPVLAPATDLALSLVKLFSRISFADVPVPAFPPALVLFFYAGFLLFLLCNRKKYLLILPFIPFFIYAIAAGKGSDVLRVTFLDVGQGDSAVIEMPDDKTFVVDTGRTGREASSYLTFRGKRVIDALLLSHIHPDHTGGLKHISERFEIREIWHNGRMTLPGEFDRIKKRMLERGDRIEGKGYNMLVLHPYREFYSSGRNGYSDANNDSLVLKITYRHSFLFPGDIEEEAEQDVAHLGQWLRSDVIKIPHHGSKSSAYAPFMQAVSPEKAVVSAEKNNPFGHPHPEMLDCLRYIDVYRTDTDGAIKMEESGGKLTVRTFWDYQFEKLPDTRGELRNLRLLFETW